METRRLAALVGLVLLVSAVAAGTAAAQPDDPESDVIGWENGYWHNESIDVDQSDGLTDEELEAYVARTMARVEVLREREFEKTVPVEVISRSEYGNRTEGNASDAFRGWNNQVWEALFIAGEDEDIIESLHSTQTAATTGGYFIAADEIKIVTDTPEDATIDRRTLSHELVHALQDQHFDLANETYHGESQDEELATLGLIEGEANYVEGRYEERCDEDWECVAAPTDGGGGGSSPDINRGVLYTQFQPYSDGPPYVHSLVERDGWSAVDEKFGTPPNATEQIIHHTDEAPVPLSVTDNASGGWETFPEQGVNGTDTVGEASIFTMLWYQSWEYGADTVPVQRLVETDDPYDTFNYTSTPSAGWDNDAVLPYRKETPDGTQYGYVWTIEWETEVDADQFLEAHRAILRAHDARRLGQRTWVIEAGPYADAFRVAKEGRRVTIVNAPTIGDLDDVRPGIETAPVPTTTTPPQPDPPIDTPEPTPGDEPTPAVDQPGFGTLVALAAALIGGVAWRRWRRRRR